VKDKKWPEKTEGEKYGLKKLKGKNMA